MSLALPSERRVSDRLPVGVGGHAERRAFLGLLALAVLVRIFLVIRPVWGQGADASVVYLMALHAREGHFTAYYWGQAYGGTLLSIITGFIMVVAGPHLVVLQSVSIAFVAVNALLIRAIGRWTLSARAGDVAAVLFAFPGVILAATQFVDPGFYGPGLALALCAIWLVVRGDRRKPYWQWLLLGLAVGLALWQLLLVAALALPAVVFQVIRQPSVTRWLVGLGGAVVGALPALVVAARAGSLQTSTSQSASRHLVQSLHQYFTAMLPAAFGIDFPSHHLLRLVIAAVSALLLCALVVLAVVRRSGKLAVVAAAGPIVILGTAFGASASNLADVARYAEFICPFLALAIGALLDRWVVAALGVAVLAVVATLVPLAGLVASAPPRQDVVWPPEVSKVAAIMRADGVTAAYGDYTMAYRFSAAEGERLKMAALTPRRYPPYEAAAAAQKRTLVVVLAGGPNDAVLGKQAQPHTRQRVGAYEVYTFDGRFNPYTIAWPGV